MHSLRTQAEAYAQALEMGLLETREVVAWVDREIAASDVPALPLIEASLAQDDINALLSALRNFPGEEDPAGTFRLLLGHMRRALAANPALVDPIVEKLFRMAVDAVLPNPEMEGEVFALEGDLEMFQAGIQGSLGEVRRKLERFLKKFG